ncbi:MAG: LysR family transcriptional regulator [Labilithrix sp.]|nr:LysR family transcriptional regulator [Labilithrix sp.]MCW5814895.1 LysR family transcriptional regulator [Labilithrix sp.]
MTLPSVESLRCFCAAAKFLNFRAASRAVALTPAAFGQRIKQLEDQLGAQLFVRTTRSVRLSTAGLSLLPVAQRAIASLEDCARAVSSTGQLPQMDIVLGTRHELGVSWVLPQIDQLKEVHPSVELHLYFGSGPDLVNRVRMMQIDCAITSSRLNDPKLDSIRLHREDYVFVGAPSLLDEVPFAKPEDSSRHTLVELDDDLPLFRYWRDSPKGVSLTFAKLARFGTIEAIRQRLVAGAGVGVLPKYLVQPDLDAKRLRLVLPKIVPQHDYFRLVIRADDPRRSVFEGLAASLMDVPLR